MKDYIGITGMLVPKIEITLHARALIKICTVKTSRIRHIKLTFKTEFYNVIHGHKKVILQTEYGDLWEVIVDKVETFYYKNEKPYSVLLGWQLL